VDYQFAFQESLGSFNVLDMWGNFRVSDSLNIRVGRMVTPFIYEYYIFWPGWGPVITLSPLFQIAGRRREGVMGWGRLLGNKIQYQQGVFNAADGSFFDLGTQVSYTGSLDVTPWKGSNGPFDSLGVGVGIESSIRSYSLAAGAASNFVAGAGEPSTNNLYFGSSGVPFFIYVPTMLASGMQTRVAPHLYWYGRFSVLAEWAYSERHLTNSATGVEALEQVNGYYVYLSYFLTGERYTGDGLSGFSAIAPNRPFSFRNPRGGIGAWELGFQYAQLHLNPNVVNAGFADPLVNATQLNQMMLGVNWYMNKYTKISFDWVDARTNKAVPLGSNGTLSNTYDVFWTRVALMF
jgi:phosphate-selective porin OprO/OprP